MELGFLNPLYERPGPWASVYFDTGAASEDAAARQELSARSACERLESQGADRDTCRAMYDALVSLPRERQPAGRALFASHGEVVLDPALTTPPDGGPYVSWQPLPHTGPLLALAGGEPVCLVAYIDRAGADFELRGPLGEQRAGAVEGQTWPMHRTPSKDWSERHFQTSVENTWEHNAGLIAEALSAHQEETGADLLILSGDARECRAVRDRLPAGLREHAIEAEHGVRADAPGRPVSRNTAAGSRLLDEEVEQARAVHTRRHVSDVLESFQTGRAPGDHAGLDAAEGVPALVEAAREHRIAALLVRPDGADVHREVWVGDEPDQIAVRRTEAHSLGAREPHTARADDALLRSAAMTGAEVLYVEPSAVPEGVPEGLPEGGLGALLRWSYGEAPEGGGTGGGQRAAGQ